jgi:hypothetical protein
MLPLLAVAAFLLGQPGEGIRFRKTDKAVEVVAYLSAAARDRIAAGAVASTDGESWLRLHVFDPETKRLGPPMLGRYERKDDLLIFRPRFALEPGLTYRAEFGAAGKALFTANYRVPERVPTTPPRIVRIYPTGDVLPANHLKFYIYFSQPMRGGSEIFGQLAIVDATGKEVTDPWLHDELWDEDDQCLILYIHPGRIKWGVLLRELLGPVLLPERQYSLVIRGAMRDAQGQALGKEVVKKFRTTGEDRKRIELADWKVTPPAAGASGPVTVAFPKSIDHKSLERFLSVVDAAGQRLEGVGAIGKNEQTWSFTPKTAWQAQEYRLQIDGRLEDVAGNTPRQPFDVDLRTPPAKSQSLERRFRASIGTP